MLFFLFAGSGIAQYARNREIPRGEWDNTKYNTKKKRAYLRMDEFGAVQDAKREDVILVENNAYRDIDGVLIGRFDPMTGEVRNHSGRRLGYINEDSEVFKWDGTLLGIEKRLNKEQVALVYFLWSIYLGWDRMLFIPE